MYDAYQSYAIAWVPRATDALGRFGHDWTGWCAEQGMPMERRPLTAIGSMLEGITTEVAQNGLQGRLAGPFALAGLAAAWRLETELAALAQRTGPITLPALRPVSMDGRLCLAPAAACRSLDRLIGELRAIARSFRQPASEPATGGFHDAAEPFVARQIQSGFHIPLTDRTGAFRLARLRRALSESLAEAPLTAVRIQDIVLMGDPGGARPRTALCRLELTGSDPRELRPGGRGFQISRPVTIYGGEPSQRPTG